MKDPFIEQTAKDYDMNYEDVKDIKDRFPDNFYEMLERFIEHRAKTN